MSASLPLVRQQSVDGLLTPMRQACPREGPSGATCVQRLDGSRDSAIHTTYRISLRSSSMREPRYPLPRVIFFLLALATDGDLERLAGASALPCSLASSRAVFRPATNAPGGREGGGRWGREGGKRLRGSILSRVRRSCFWKGNDNDPSAGSPTETLLRLLLPLNDKVQWTSRDVTGGEPPASPRSEHFTGPFNR